MIIGRLHVITDTTLQGRFSALDLATYALAGGAEVIQYREKRAPTRRALEEAASIADVCRRRRAQFIVNDRADLAWAADATGVHLGDDDLPLALARRLLGPDRLLGASADCDTEVAQRTRAGADYVGIGPVFATSSKADTGPRLGLDGLRRAVAASRIPLIAIGGVDASNLASVLETGVHGAAVLSGVCCADDPEAATAALMSIVREHARAS